MYAVNEYEYEIWILCNVFAIENRYSSIDGWLSKRL